MPTTQKIGDFAHDYTITDDKAVVFRCSADQSKWPWLALDPAHNIAVQMTNYYVLTGVEDAAGQRAPDKWTALTQFNWRVFDNKGGHSTHGVSDKRVDGDDAAYGCTYFNASGNLVYRVMGEGVTFRNRDFESWRRKSKDNAMTLPEPTDFVYATPSAVGTALDVEVMVSTLSEDEEGLFAQGLVTKENGFPPAHPYHDGSGDHVNSTHLCDALQQTAHQIRARESLLDFPRGGEAKFSSYVELDRPFRISLIKSDKSLKTLTFKVTQAGKVCTRLSFFYD